MNSAAQSNHVITYILSRLKEVGGLKGTDIANIADVSKATVSRWSLNKKSPQPKIQMLLSNLHYIVMRLSDYYSAEETRAWLYARHPQLNGERALDLIHADRSEEVLGALDRLDDDVYL